MTNQLSPFEFYKPADRTALWQLIDGFQQTGKRFDLYAGGTDLIPLYKQQLSPPDALVSLQGLNELKGIQRVSENRLRIGALTSLSSLANNADIQQQVPALALAASKVASPQIRNQATLGGNVLVTHRCIYFNQSEHNRISHEPCFKANGEVCHLVKSAQRGKLPLCVARFVSDTVPVLLLLDANLIVISAEGERTLPLRNFYLQDGIECHRLQPNEILAAIEFDATADLAMTYEKLAIRQTLDFPSLGVAVGLKKIAGAFELSVAMTGVHNHPIFQQYESIQFSSFDDMLERACIDCSELSLTYQQDFYPRAYRKKMISVFIRRGVRQLQGEL